MKCLNLFLILLSCLGLSAQDGLESIYIETYYVSSVSDRNGKVKSGDLDSGSVTYRLYVDLRPGYRFQAAYGSPEHPLEIKSKSKFFNHNHSGNTHPSIIPERDLSHDIALLDSWLTVGAATEHHLGIPRKDDMLIADESLQFESGYLENTYKKDDNDLSPLGLKLQQCDGLARSLHQPVPTFYMIDSVLWALSSVSRSERLYIENGAWACMGKGSVGADSTSGNHVLIAQLTTSGGIEARLNIMIGTPEGKSIRYVWGNPQDDEIVHPALICSSNYVTANVEKRKAKSRKKRKA